MFKDSGSDAMDVAGGDYPPAHLSHAQIAPEVPNPANSPAQRIAALAGRYGEWRERVSQKLSAVDLVPDLALDIGSRHSP